MSWGGGGGGGKKAENGEEVCIRASFIFFLLFVFHAESGTKNNDRTGLSDISY